MSSYRLTHDPEGWTLTPERKHTMTTTADSVQFVVEYVTRFTISRDFESTQYRLSMLARSAGLAIDPDYDGHMRFDTLCALAADAIDWVTALDGDDSRQAFTRVLRQDVQAEWERANRKHNGNTPAKPSMPDMDRAAILLEEVGEVARALTPDADTPTGHAGNLRDELVQVAAMAVAWASTLRED